MIRSTALTVPVMYPEQFTAQNPPPAELADFIRPVGFRACPSCGGTGLEPGSDHRPCGSCDGEGTVDW